MYRMMFGFISVISVRLFGSMLRLGFDMKSSWLTLCLNILELNLVNQRFHSYSFNYTQMTDRYKIACFTNITLYYDSKVLQIESRSFCILGRYNKPYIVPLHSGHGGIARINILVKKRGVGQYILQEASVSSFKVIVLYSTKPKLQR